MDDCQERVQEGKLMLCIRNWALEFSSLIVDCLICSLLVIAG